MESIDIDALAAALVARINPQGAPTPGILFDEFCALYMDNHARPRKKTWREDQRRIRKDLLPAFTGRQLLHIKRTDIIALHAHIGTRAPYSANRTLEQLAKMFRLAQLWGYYPEDRILPTTGIPPFREHSRDVFVQKDEMPRLAAAIAKCRSVKYQVLFWLYLLTALRRSELLHARWSDLDTDRWELRIPGDRTKNGKPHYLPLTAEAMALFASLPRRSVYIFPGAKPNKPLNNSTVWRSFNRVRRRAGLQHLRIHDLRRTVASWMAQSGCPLSLLGKLLNHGSARATEIYARFAQDDVRTALEQYATTLSKHISKTSI